MSDYLMSLQEEVIGEISKNQFITNIVKGVFTHVPPNTPFPYIHVGNINFKDTSTKTSEINEVEFEVGIYSRERSNYPLFELIYNVKKTMDDNRLKIRGYLTNRQNLISCDIVQKSDGLTSCATLYYKISLTKGA